MRLILGSLPRKITGSDASQALVSAKGGRRDSPHKIPGPFAPEGFLNVAPRALRALPAKQKSGPALAGPPLQNLIAVIALRKD
jgi:hypothetical protein